MFKIKKSFSKMIVAALLTLIVLASCSPSKPAPQITIRFGFWETQSYLPYFVIQEKGFSKENGLQFVETSYAGGGGIIEAMATGSLDAGFSGTVPVLLAGERGLIPEKIVPLASSSFADPDHPALGVLVASAIKSWKDLEGKQIAINARNSLLDAAIRGRLQMEGVQNYKLIEISFSNMGLAVAGGNIAAAIMSEPFLTQSLLRRDGKLLDWIVGGAPFERMEYMMIVFRGDLYRNNPQMLKAFLRAYLKSVRWIDQNKEEARSILAKRLSISQEVSQKIKLLHWPLDARNDPALLESMQPLLVEIGMLKKPIPAKQLYDETLLEEVLKEKR